MDFGFRGLAMRLSKRVLVGVSKRVLFMNFYKSSFWVGKRVLKGFPKRFFNGFCLQGCSGI